MLSDDQALAHLPLVDIWEWQVGVACRQTGSQRLKAIHLLLRILQCSSKWYVQADLEGAVKAAVWWLNGQQWSAPWPHSTSSFLQQSKNMPVRSIGDVK